MGSSVLSAARDEGSGIPGAMRFRLTWRFRALTHRPAGEAYSLAMAGPAGPGVQPGDEIGKGVDGPVELGEVTAQGCKLVRVARAGGTHRMVAEQGLGPQAGLRGDVIADQLQGVEDGTVLGHDLVERLVPAERVGADDRRLVAMHQRQQLGQRDAGKYLLE